MLNESKGALRMDMENIFSTLSWIQKDEWFSRPTTSREATAWSRNSSRLAFKESTSPDLPLDITNHFRTYNLQDPDTVLRGIYQRP